MRSDRWSSKCDAWQGILRQNVDTRHSARLTSAWLMSIKRHERTESSSCVRVPSPRGTETCPVTGSQRSRRELFDLASVFQAAMKLSKVAAAIAVILFVADDAASLLLGPGWIPARVGLAEAVREAGSSQVGCGHCRYLSHLRHRADDAASLLLGPGSVQASVGLAEALHEAGSSQVDCDQCR